jgi:hypothetical protein
MEILGILAMALTLIGWIWLVVLGFKDHWGWGLGIFFFGILGLVYGFMNFAKAKVPTIILTVGIVLYFVAGASIMATMR